MLVVVHTPATHAGGGRPVKSSRERMEIVNAYVAVGSYRGAAALCGTTHKTGQPRTRAAGGRRARATRVATQQHGRRGGSDRPKGIGHGRPHLSQAAPSDLTPNDA